MSICMGIIMLVADQLMYDRHNSKRNKIYRITTNVIDQDGLEQTDNTYATAPLPLRNELLENYTGVEKAARLVRGFGNSWIEFDQDVNVPLHGFYADPEVLDIFEHELEHGDARTALVEPYSVVLTKKAAKKLFKQDNPVGETIKVGKLGNFKVTGIIKETETKSHIVFEALASVSTLKNMQADGRHDRQSDLESWNNFTAGWVYFVLENGKSSSDIHPHLDQIFQKKYANITNPDLHKLKFHLQNLGDITPGPFLNNPIGPFLPWVFIYFFAGLAGVVMLTSCFNFTNLSIARSLTRAREIGVRKVNGAARWQIFTQFLSESIIIALIALGLSFVLLLAVKPLMLELNFARVLKWDLEASTLVYAVFLLFAVVVGILAGLFPAVVLSGFQPVKVLKSIKSIKLFSRLGLRKALLISQFTLSLIFILTVFVVYNQLNLFLGADHGFSMRDKIMIRLNNTPPQSLKTELLKFANIESVAAASHIPAAGTSYGNGFKKNLDEKEWTALNYFSADEDYLKNMDVKLVAGKYFSPEAGESNSGFIVINEKAVNALHYESAIDALGEEIIFQQDSSRKVIIGVVKDYNHQILIDKLEPMALMYTPDQYSILQVSYTGTYEDAARSVEKAWANVNPTLKIDYKDFEAEIKTIYDIFFGDVVNVLGVISFLAIVISCLGLLGMATYTTETRIKEISIRKVLGSSNGSLVYLLSKGFLSILIVAIILAVPAAYFLNNLWLENIAYHVSVDVFTVALGVFMLIAFGVVTIGSQTWRAVFVNPVDNLKNE
ncbi:MAG: ABC transporter permease [Flammeovirgaceae bacterium]|nr:ABC transporter permease [Flammeovirgaceae bacterium]